MGALGARSAHEAQRVQACGRPAAGRRARASGRRLAVGGGRVAAAVAGIQLQADRGQAAGAWQRAAGGGRRRPAPQLNLATTVIGTFS